MTRHTILGSASALVIGMMIASGAYAAQTIDEPSNGSTNSQANHSSNASAASKDSQAASGTTNTLTSTETATKTNTNSGNTDNTAQNLLRNASDFLNHSFDDNSIHNHGTLAGASDNF